MSIPCRSFAERLRVVVRKRNLISAGYFPEELPVFLQDGDARLVAPDRGLLGRLLGGEPGREGLHRILPRGDHPQPGLLERAVQLDVRGAHHGGRDGEKLEVREAVGQAPGDRGGERIPAGPRQARGVQGDVTGLARDLGVDSLVPVGEVVGPQASRAHEVGQGCRTDPVADRQEDLEGEIHRLAGEGGVRGARGQAWPRWTGRPAGR